MYAGPTCSKGKKQHLQDQAGDQGTRKQMKKDKINREMKGDIEKMEIRESIW
jgi:hypothetical protein